MCITAFKSILDYTHIGVWDIDHPQYGYRHVTAYQNRVKNLSEDANCMLLHIPSSEPILPEHLIDTSQCTEFLRKLYLHMYPIVSVEEVTGDWMGAATDSINYVVEQGVYHIALLNSLDSGSIKTTLEKIPESKRPEISPNLIAFFKEHFPDFPLVLCCFNTLDAKMAAPVMIHFAPQFPDTLMVNTLDSHGGIPDISTSFTFHQQVVFGTHQKPEKPNGILIDMPKHFYPELSEFLPSAISALDLDLSRLPNKDICIDLKSVHAGDSPSITLELLGSQKQKHKTRTYKMGTVFKVGIPSKIGKSIWD